MTFGRVDEQARTIKAPRPMIDTRGSVGKGWAGRNTWQRSTTDKRPMSKVDKGEV
jgi:hypothetical protein